MLKPNWLFFSFLTLLMWGLWAFFPRLALGYLNPKSAYLLQQLGAITIALILLISLKFQVQFNAQGAIFAILSGVVGTLGFLFFLYAISYGNASVVIAMTALYPLIAIALAFFILKDPITMKQSIGIVLALVAIVLLST